MIFLIKTSGKGMLPKGITVGHIEAETLNEASDNLIFKYNSKKQVISGQLPEKYRGFFDFELKHPGDQKP